MAKEAKAVTDRARVLAFIRSCGATGATDQEIQAKLGLSGDSERPRQWELVKARLIKASNLRNWTEAGRHSIAWISTK